MGVDERENGDVRRGRNARGGRVFSDVALRTTRCGIGGVSGSGSGGGAASFFPWPWLGSLMSGCARGHTGTDTRISPSQTSDDVVLFRGHIGANTRVNRCIHQRTITGSSSSMSSIAGAEAMLMAAAPPSAPATTGGGVAGTCFRRAWKLPLRIRRSGREKRGERRAARVS